MRCGNCKGEHPTVDEVRECHTHNTPEPVEAPPRRASWLRDAQDARREQVAENEASEECGKCHNRFATLAEVFSHPCGDTSDRRIAVPRMAPPNAEARPATQAPVKRNRFGARCRKCNGWVDEGVGLLVRDEGAWKVEHEGDCPAPKARPQQRELPDVPAGHYAIPSTGTNDLAFYRVDRPTEGEYAGGTYIKLIVGGHPDSKVPFKNVPGILARIVEQGIEASATLYGTEIGRCYRCNIELTKDDSRALGIGPECRKKL